MNSDSIRLIVLRHAQTQWNREGRYQGRTDIPLCSAGIEQAQAAGQALRHAGAHLVLSSPLTRARATAEVICEVLGSNRCVIEDRLVELSFGEWEGLIQPEVKWRWPEQLRDWKRAPHVFRFPGGEQLSDAFDRLQDLLRHPPWTTGATPRCVIAVTHATPLRLAALCAEGRPLSEYRQVAVPAHGALEFDWDPRGRLRPLGVRPLN